MEEVYEYKALKMRESSLFWKDIELMKHFSDQELIKIFSKIIHIYPLKYEDFIGVIGDETSPENFGYLDNAQRIFRYILDMALVKKPDIGALIEDLSNLGFSETFLDDFKTTYQTQEPRLQGEMENKEPNMTHEYCDMQWRFIRVLDDSISLERNCHKIHLNIMYHSIRHKHESALIELTPDQFESFYEEISKIKEIVDAH